MQGSPFRLPIVLAALAPILAATALSAPARAATLVYSNDVMGELEPCGCRKNPQGGLVRKEELLRQLREKDPEILQVDAGNLLFASEDLPEVLAKQSEIQAEYLVDGLNRLGHDAVTPGPKDFSRGLKFFEKLRKRAKFDFLAANLLGPDGKRLLEARKVYVRKDKDGRKLRIGVFGVVGADLGWKHGLKATDPVAAANEQVAALKKDKADLVIALSHQGLEADRVLARKVKGIHVIVGAHSQSFLQYPEEIGGTRIYQSSFRNQYIGVLPLPTDFKGENHELVGLDAAYDSEKKTALAERVEAFKAEVAKLNTEESEKLQAIAQANAGKQLVAKFQTLPRCAECHMTQFDFWRKTRHGNALESLLKADQIRNKECLGCHTLGLGDKQGFSLIERIAERGDLEEAAEPAAGEGKKAPARSPYLGPEAMASFFKSVHEAKTLDQQVKLSSDDKDSEPIHQAISRIRRTWAPVQCENCHGPGQDHPFTQGYGRKPIDVTQVCVECHTPARAPSWYDKAGKLDLKIAEAKKKSIACPADETVE